MEVPVQIQQRATKMVEGPEQATYTEGPGKLSLGKAHGDLITVYKPLMGSSKED